jgi:putative spermidine/putrescine transport system permease protein
MSTGKYRYIPPQPPLWFSMAVPAGIAAIVGLLSAQGNTALMLPGMAVGAIIAAVISAVLITLNLTRFKAGVIFAALMVAFGTVYSSVPFGIMIGLVGYVLGRMSIWLNAGDYRLALPPYASSREVLNFYGFRVICGGIFIFLITPILILIPLSFNQEPYFSFTEGMLALDPAAYSLRWYKDILYNGMVAPQAIEGWWEDMWANSQWVRSIKNSLFIGFFATIISTALGTLAAIGLSRSEMPYKRAVMALLISPYGGAIGDYCIGAVLFLLIYWSGQNLYWYYLIPCRSWYAICHYYSDGERCPDLTEALRDLQANLGAGAGDNVL